MNIDTGSKDVVYIQKDNQLPYITFGSKLTWNVAKQWAMTEMDVGISNRIIKEVEEDNVICLWKEDVRNMVEFIERVGIVEVEYKPTAFFHRSGDFKEWIK